MKDPVGIIVALLFIGFGSAAIFRTRWFYRAVTPEQAERDRKRFKLFGYAVLPIGLILLAVRLFSEA